MFEIRTKAEMQEFFEFFKEKQSQINAATKSCLKNLQEASDKNSKQILELKKMLSDYENRLIKITEINIAAEETLTNVLLAIRQCEFLQAWYPPQSGYPAMKITGRHPTQAKTEIL
jgi:hypothetical protein